MKIDPITAATLLILRISGDYERKVTFRRFVELIIENQEVFEEAFKQLEMVGMIEAERLSKPQLGPKPIETRGRHKELEELAPLMPKLKWPDEKEDH